MGNRKKKNEAQSLGHCRNDAYLHDGIVERDAPGRRLLDDPALQLLVPGEGVDRQRLRLRFQERDAVFDLLDLEKKTDAGARSAAS